MTLTWVEQRKSIMRNNLNSVLVAHGNLRTVTFTMTFSSPRQTDLRSRILRRRTRKGSHGDERIGECFPFLVPSVILARQDAACEANAEQAMLCVTLFSTHILTVLLNIDIRVPIYSRRSQEMFVGGQSTSKGQKIVAVVVVVVASPLRSVHR